MAKSKAETRVKLSNGDELTITDALIAGRLRLVESTYYDPPRYFARETEGDLSWEIGETFYRSRLGLQLPFNTNDSKE